MAAITSPTRRPAEAAIDLGATSRRTGGRSGGDLTPLLMPFSGMAWCAPASFFTYWKTTPTLSLADSLRSTATRLLSVDGASARFASCTHRLSARPKADATPLVGARKHSASGSKCITIVVSVPFTMMASISARRRCVAARGSERPGLEYTREASSRERETLRTMCSPGNCLDAFLSGGSCWRCARAFASLARGASTSRT
mmetsp:Transcript_4287/g.11111  ORF Transcript_4287/g.11111 Transcript_4287/m.11111 type:complete len:200 (-) Transcript_4287:209-808(-)